MKNGPSYPRNAQNTKRARAPLNLPSGRAFRQNFPPWAFSVVAATAEAQLLLSVDSYYYYYSQSRWRRYYYSVMPPLLLCL